MFELKSTLDSSRKELEAGGVLVLVAILIFALVAMVALAIELSIISAGTEQARQLTRVAALTAIEEFYSDIADCDPDQDGDCIENGLEAAVTRVNDLFADARLFSEKDSSSAPRVSLAPQAGEASLIPGMWLTRAPELLDGQDLVDCGDGQEENYPCFAPMELGTISLNNTPNAFRIEGTFFPSITLKMGAKIFNVAALQPFVAATATFMPRRGCFLIDVSPTITYDSHLPWHGGGPYSYPMGQQPPPNQPPKFNAHVPGAITLNEDCLNPEESGEECGPLTSEAFGNHYAYFFEPDNTDATEATAIEYFYLYPSMDIGWAALINDSIDPDNPLSQRGANTFEPFKHYASDYQSLYLLSDEDYNVDFALHHPDPDNDDRYSLPYRHLAHVDVYPFSAPEPLRSLVDGVNEALGQFSDRRVAGDRACLIFFDRRVTWPRIVRMTDDFDYLIDFTNFDLQEEILSDGEEPPDFSSDGVGEGRLRTIRHGIMPFRGQFTDIQAALQEAMLQLDESREDGVPASEFVVVISDGLQNCYYNTGNHGLGSNVSCSNELGHYQLGIQQIYDKLDPEDPSDPDSFRRVPVHFILDGAMVGPHTVDLPKGGNLPDNMPSVNTTNCYTDAEYRAKQGFDINSIEFVTGGGTENWENMSAKAPFFEVNMDWYKVAVVTQGLWGPLRSRNDLLCDNLPDFDGLPPDQEKYFDPANFRPMCDPEDVEGNHSVDGRRVFDPYCMTKQQQIRRYLNTIIGDNPYTVVEVK